MSILSCDLCYDVAVLNETSIISLKKRKTLETIKKYLKSNFRLLASRLKVLMGQNDFEVIGERRERLR